MNNERLKGSLVRYLHPTDHHPARITKGDKYFSKRLHFKDIKFSGKFTDTHKVEKQNSIRISIFGYENKVKKSNLCVKKCCDGENVDLL